LVERHRRFLLVFLLIKRVVPIRLGMVRLKPSFLVFLLIKRVVPIRLGMARLKPSFLRGWCTSRARYLRSISMGMVCLIASHRVEPPVKMVK
jgi:hypothetical protein